MSEMGFKDSEKQTTADELTAEKPQIKEQKEKLVLPEYFSFTQLMAFSHCPLQYKFAHILKVPVSGKANFSFGKTMHNTLYEFLKANNGLNASQSLFKERVKEEKTLSFDELIKIYNKNWIDEWYNDRAQKEEYYKSGKKALKNFYEEFIKSKPEILRINNELCLEASFKIKIGGHTMIGKVDRIDNTKEGIEVIDYKTGSSRDKFSPEDKRQLFLYQLAAEEAFGVKPVKLTYYYLENGKRASFAGSEEEKQKQKEKILTEIEEIKKSDFIATPGWQCRYCDFKDICDFAQKNNF